VTSYQSGEDQGCIISLESLAREFVVVARLRNSRSGATGKPILSQPSYHIRKICVFKDSSAVQKHVVKPPKGLGQESGLKGPKVAAMRPEAGRSNPGQVEAVRKDGGGLNQC
jgi:hypothetical protein